MGEQRTIYRCDHRHKPAQVDDTPRQRKGEELGTSSRSDAESPRSRCSDIGGCTCATPTQRNRGRVIAGGAGKISSRAQTCAYTRAHFVCTYIRRKGKRRRNEPTVLITPTWPGTRAPAFHRGIFPIIRCLIKYHS